MRDGDKGRWAGAFTLDANARWLFTIEALADPFRSWLADLGKRRDAGQDVASELAEGQALIRAAVARAARGDAHRLREPAARIARAPPHAAAVARASDPELAALVHRHLARAAAAWAGR